jgi:hypothetical protein
MRRQLERLVLKHDAAELSGEQLRVQRAVQVLEYLGTAEARQFLDKLAQGARAFGWGLETSL